MAAGFKSLTPCQSLQFIGKISAIHRQLIGNASGEAITTFNDYSEDAMIEQPTVAFSLPWAGKTLNCFHERIGPGGTNGRENSAEVVLVPKVFNALKQLQP